MDGDLALKEAKTEVIPSYQDLDEGNKLLIDQTIEQIHNIVNDEALTLMERVGELLISDYL